MQSSNHVVTNTHHPILKVCCLITRSDFDIACQSNQFDRMTIIAGAAALVLATLIATLVWSAFFGNFLSLFVSIPLGFLMGVLIFILDQALGVSDWTLEGVLRTERRSAMYWGKAIFRVGITLIFAQATAIGASMLLFSDAIEGQMQSKRAMQNVSLDDKYAARKDKFAQQLLEPIQGDLESLRKERNVALQNIRKNELVMEEARLRASNARIDAGREHNGFQGYVKGNGPKWADAKMQESEANLMVGKGSENIGIAQAAISEYSSQIESLTRQLEVRNREYETKVHELDLQKKNDPTWVPKRNDPLLRYMAFTDLKQNPDSGASVREFSFLLNIVLVVCELIFLLINVVFAPASVYTARIIARTRLEAAQVAVEYEQNINAIKRKRPLRGFRIVDDEAQQAGG